MYVQGFVEYTKLTETVTLTSCSTSFALIAARILDDTSAPSESMAAVSSRARGLSEISSVV